MKKFITFMVICLTAIAANAQFSNINTTMSDCNVGIFINDNIIPPVKYYKMKVGGNAFLSGLTYGIAKVNNKNYYKGKTSPNVIQPGDTITFKFGQVPMNYAQTMYMFNVNFGISNFMISKMDKKKDHRELKTASVSIWSGADVGTNASNDVEFKLLSAENNTYKIKFTKIEPGEYCFVFSNNGVGAFEYVFDFSIPEK